VFNDVYKAVHIGQPNYLDELIQPYQPVRTLRSSTSALLVIPFVRSDVASDAFSVSSPTLWNSLPQDLRSCPYQATFKSRLKSHLFFSRLYRLVTDSMRLRFDSFEDPWYYTNFICICICRVFHFTSTSIICEVRSRLLVGVDCPYMFRFSDMSDDINRQ